MKNARAYILLILFAAGVFTLLSFSQGTFQFSGLVFPNSDNRLEPVDSSWGYFTAQDLDWDGELLPDGVTCSNSQLLQKTGADNWDCVDSFSVGAGSFIPRWVTVSPDLLYATTSRNFVTIGGTSSSVYVFNVDQNASTVSIGTGGNLVPQTDSSSDLGTSSIFWANL